MALSITQGNVDDRQPVERMTEGLEGKIFGDKGYIGQNLFEELLEKGLKLVTSRKKNMKPKIMEIEDKILLRKRSIIETVNDHLKNVCQIEHSRHRSTKNFVVNLFAGIVNYILLPKKPHIKFAPEVKGLLPTTSPVTC